MSDDNSSKNTNSKGHEETHNSDTMADETGMGDDVRRITEVPSPVPEDDDKSRGSGWMSLWIVLGFLAVCAIVGLAVGLTRDNDSSDDSSSSDMAATSSRISGTWIPMGAPVVPELDLEDHEQEEAEASPFAFWNFDTDGEHLVVAEKSGADQTPQVKWYSFDADEAWMHQTTLPLGDEHPDSFPIVQVSADTLVVADARAIDLHPDLDIVDTHNGLVSIFQLQGDEEQPATFNMKFQAAAGDLWGTSIALDNTATRLAVGTPLAGTPNSALDTTELSHTGVIHVYNLKALTLEWVGRPLYGPHFLATLGGAGLTLSGDGNVLAATAAGRVLIWRWNSVTNDWSETPVTLQPGVGNQVVLNDDGTLIATTTVDDQVVLYKYVCQNAYNCGWHQEGAWPGTFVTLLGDDKHMAIGYQREQVQDKDHDHEGDEGQVEQVIQVYRYSDDDDWQLVGNALPGVAAAFVDENRIVIQQTNGGVLQTWQWAGF